MKTKSRRKLKRKLRTKSRRKLRTKSRRKLRTKSRRKLKNKYQNDSVGNKDKNTPEKEPIMIPEPNPFKEKPLKLTDEEQKILLSLFNDSSKRPVPKDHILYSPLPSKRPVPKDHILYSPLPSKKKKT